MSKNKDVEVERVMDSRADYEFVMKLREKLTPSERVLRRALIEGGVRMVCQIRVLKYVADFYSGRAKLVVEVDGSFHDRKGGAEYDAERDRAMEALGIKVMRFRNEEVDGDVGLVVAKIREVWIRRMPVKKRKTRKVSKGVIAEALEHLNVKS